MYVCRPKADSILPGARETETCDVHWCTQPATHPRPTTHRASLGAGGDRLSLPEGGPVGEVLEVSRVEQLGLVEAQLGAGLQEDIHVVLETGKQEGKKDI